MRDVINKNHTEDELLQSVETAAREGYTSAKLYFMCGLPGENDDDVRAILDLGHKALRARAAPRKRSFRITVSVSPHMPKPHTPFAWAEQVSSTAELNRRLGVLRQAARGKSVTLKYRDAETSLLEGVFTRGDRRLGGVDRGRVPARLPLRRVERAPALRHLARRVPRSRHRPGALPDRSARRNSSSRGTSSSLRSPRSSWCARSCARTRPRSRTTVVSRTSASRAASPSARSARGSSSAARAARRRARAQHASTCGRPARCRAAPRTPRSATVPRRACPRSTRFRIMFEKTADMRFTSHLDLMRTWERSLRRSRLPLAYTQGHHPHLKMSFGPPLPLGYRSRAEVFDLEFSQPPAVDLAERLQAVVPAGISVAACRPILFKTPSLDESARGRVLSGAVSRAVLRRDRPIAGSLARGARDAHAWSCSGGRTSIVRRRSEAQTREFDARPRSCPSRSETRTANRRSTRTSASPCAPRFAPTIWSPSCCPARTPRTVDVERVLLWAEVAGRRLDPLELLCYDARHG